MSICTEPKFKHPIVGITLNYRDANRTYRCVQSLLANAASHVLVWDNSEDDGASADELTALLGHDSRVSIEISTANLGFAAGVNRGAGWIIDRWPHAWVLLINNDATLLPGAIAALVSALQHVPAATIAYPSIDHKGSPVSTLYYHPVFALVTNKRILGSIPYASGCCQLLAPERLDGPWFDEDFFMYGEDVELGNRLGGHRMVPVPSALVFHEGSASSGMASPFYETHIVAAHWLLAQKLAKNQLQLGLFLLGRLFSLPVRALLRVVRQRKLVPITALWKGWKLGLTGHFR